ncbi:MAG TPA: hypothetical protein VFS00_25055, partial [Polyangiaceae bacterium]|nr:hypothetical protein [Polyangiaceae bacterium]
ACGVLGAGCFIGPIDGGGYGEEGGKGGSGGAGGGAGGTSGAGGGGAADECESNQDCILEHQSETYLCRKDPAGNVCVNVLSEQCPRLFAELGDMGADPVVFGTLGAPSVAPPFAQAESALDLARRDFRNALGVALGRPVVWLSCDASLTSPDDHVAATNHLLDEVRAPAVVLTAPVASWLAYLAERAEGRGAVAFSAFGFDDGPAGASFFSNGPRPSDEARAQAAVVAVSEANARAEGQEGELRLVYLNPGTPFAEPAAQAFFTSVRFNGKGAQENGANYRELAYGNPASPDFGVTLAAALAEAAAFAPQLVACSGPGCEAAFLQLELVHPGAHYVLPASARSPEVRAKLGDEALRKRVLGTLPGRSDDDPVAATFDVRFAASFP